MEIILSLIFLILCMLIFFVLKIESSHLKKYFEYSRCEDTDERIKLIKKWEVQAFKIAYPKVKVNEKDKRPIVEPI